MYNNVLSAGNRICTFSIKQNYLKVPTMAMHFIVMDLMGKFKLPPHGQQYALTAGDILTNYTWCILLFTKQADEVVHAYLVNVYSKFDGLHKVLSGNGTEFKNTFFVQVAST